MQILLLVGVKLQVIITKMGKRTHEMADVVKGTPTVQPGDDLFWFGRPQLVLLLINFVLFQVNRSTVFIVKIANGIFLTPTSNIFLLAMQNAFQVAFFLWGWVSLFGAFLNDF